MEYLVSYVVLIQWLMLLLVAGLGVGLFCAGLMVQPKLGVGTRRFCSWAISLAGGSLFFTALSFIIWPID